MMVKALRFIGCVIACIGLLAVCGCSATETTSSKPVSSGTTSEFSSLTSPVAATVNGTEISEQSITDEVASFRQVNGYTDDAEWAAWMVGSGYTAETVRKTLIDSRVDEILIQQLAAARSITVDTDAVDDYIQQLIDQYGSEDEYIEVLAKAGWTEDTWRAYVEQGFLEQALMDSVTPKLGDGDEADDQQQTDFTEWLSEQKDSAEIVINDMPSGLPYDVK